MVPVCAWPRGLLDNQSSYKPPWVATNVTALTSYVASANGKNPYLENVMTSTPAPLRQPGVDGSGGAKLRGHRSQGVPIRCHCPPVNPNISAASTGSDTTYAAVRAACQDLAIFAKIADISREESDSGELHQSGYRSEMSPFPVPEDLSRSDPISPTP